MPEPAVERAERERLRRDAAGWRRWGPYLAERAWGTVREDYSADSNAWDYFPHDHARSRAYRWNEDGMAGICDQDQLLCFSLALWNGRDPILKERFFGLTGNQGNHGEDVKEYWWFLDATPTYSWMRWIYMYPQAAFPYEQLVAENQRRSRTDPEYELLDTAIFDGDRYWEVTVDIAKASIDDILLHIEVQNHGPDEATLEVLPTVWFRNTWSWAPGSTRPLLHADRATLVADHPAIGRRVLCSDGDGVPLICDNDTNTQRLWGVTSATPYAKDGINDHLLTGARTVNPAGTGTKGALQHRLVVAGGGSASIRLRFAPQAADVGAGHDRLMRRRHAEADAYYRSLTPADASDDEAAVMRQAFAGLLWGKQFYHFNVERWLSGDPGQPPPPAERVEVRNREWWHLDNRDVIAMPDTWEYPWYAAWDLAFHCVAIAHLDADFAKQQLILLCREWYMHPNGQLPAYEWSFGDVNPPVHAWGALTVFSIDGARDYEFLERIFHKLLINFTWWINRKDAEGNNVFEGGFLGLDNIGPMDRSAMLPMAGRLLQADATAWMAMYCLDMLKIALTLARHDRTYEDVATKFFEHFAYIALAITTQGIWDEQDGLFYDVLETAGGRTPVRARSLVGIIPLLAVTTLDPRTLEALPDFAERMRWFEENRPEFASCVAHIHARRSHENRLLSVVGPERLRRVLGAVLDEGEFLSPYGIRSVSRHHLEHPLELDIGSVHGRLDYEPGESTTPLYGGNSNWRGPVWFPINHLLIAALRRFHHALGPQFTVEMPAGSGVQRTLDQIADELARRLVAIFLEQPDGRRPVFGESARLQGDPRWHGNILFHEYFHGDTGAGLGASHQTGWTALVADLITRRRAPAALP
ncbi:MAG: glucosidase [Chloroflexi bacterium]|nr:MAG: glucosidase [Chloroflexota bacterium]